MASINIENNFEIFKKKKKKNQKTMTRQSQRITKKDEIKKTLKVNESSLTILEKHNDITLHKVLALKSELNAKKTREDGQLPPKKNSTLKCPYENSTPNNPCWDFSSDSESDDEDFCFCCYKYYCRCESSCSGCESDSISSNSEN